MALLVAVVLFPAAATAQQPAEAPASAPEPAATPPRPADPPRGPATRKEGAATRVESLEITEKRSTTTERRDSTASKIVIGREEIEQYGDTNLGDVMRRLPGVTQGGRPGRGGPVRMRGMGGGFTQILINGDRIPPGFSMEDITPEQVERIEILRAPTAETGTRAIAGTINIILREALRERRNDVRAGVQEENGHYSPNASFSRNDSLSETGSYNFTLSREPAATSPTTAWSRPPSATWQPDAITLAQRNELASNSVNESLFATSRFQWRLGPGEQFSLQPFVVASNNRSDSRGRLTQEVGVGALRHQRVAIRQPVPPCALHDAAQPPPRSADDVRAARRRGHLHGGRRLRAGPVRRGRHPHPHAGRQQRDPRHLVERGRQGGAALGGSAHLHDRRGVGAGHAQGKAAHAPERRAAARGVRHRTRREGAPRGALPAGRVGPESELVDLAGLRWEAIDTRSAAEANPVDNRSSVVNPLAHVVWRFDAPKRDQVRASITQSYRPPTTQNLVARPRLNTLYPVTGPNTATSPDIAGNASLKPEIANGLELAFERYLAANGVLSANLFTRRLNDVIRSVTALEQVSWSASPRWVTRPQNLGRAVTSGIELEAKFGLREFYADAPPVNVRANLSAFRSRVDEVPGPDNRLAGQPDMTGNLGADYRFRAVPLSVGASVNWTPAYDIRQTAEQLERLRRKVVTDAYLLWHVDPATKLRLSLTATDPRDFQTNNIFLAGNERQVDRGYAQGLPGDGAAPGNAALGRAPRANQEIEGELDMNIRPPLTIRMHADDNVAIVANDGGLPAGTVLPEGMPGAGLTLRDKVPQGHKVALATSPAGAVGAPLQRADRPCARGHRRRQLGARAPAARCRRPARSTACRWRR